MISIRRKRRLRGKRKELRREALKTFDILCRKTEPQTEDWNVSFGSVILPLIRNVMPQTIAADLVGVQPMTAPQQFFGDSAAGIEWSFRMSEPRKTNKEKADERKQARRAKKESKKRAEETAGED